MEQSSKISWKESSFSSRSKTELNASMIITFHAELSNVIEDSICWHNLLRIYLLYLLMKKDKTSCLIESLGLYSPFLCIHLMHYWCLIPDCQRSLDYLDRLLDWRYSNLIRFVGNRIKVSRIWEKVSIKKER
jgi:hypothetical protein